MSYYAILTGDSYIAHHGIKGQKWGVRRYQNADGSLTAAGYNHYYGHSKEMDRAERKEFKSAMNADRKAWKKSAKENYKAAKERVKSGEISEESKAFQNAKRDRYMSKHGSKEGIDRYRYGTKEQKNAAIQEAAKRKAGKIATTAALGTVGAVGIGTTAVAGLAIADALAKIGLTATAVGAGGLTAGAAAVVGTAGAAATSKGLGKNTMRMLDKQYNKRDNFDGSETYRGTGSNATTIVNLTKLKKDGKGNIIDPEGQKMSLFKSLDSEINRFAADKVSQNTPGIVNQANYSTIKEGHKKRIDSIYDNLQTLGVSKSNIDDYIKQQSAGINSYGDWDHNIDYNYDERHRRAY